MADQRTWGLLAQFENPARLMEAAEKTRDAGYQRFEAWSPFPIHGMDDAMGLPLSRIPWVVLFMALTGLTGGFLLQWWTGAVDYELIIGGKPLFSWEFGLPVMFEATVLLSAFGAVFGWIIMNGLPRPYHPLDRVQAFKKVTDDGFFLTIEAKDPKFDVEQTRAFLQGLGGQDVTLVEE
jgi:hypothetical protein